MPRIVFYILLLLVQGCIEPVTFRGDESEPTLVVAGLIVPHHQPLEIQLSLTSPFGTFYETVSGAQVKLYDALGHRESYEEVGESPGLFRLSPQIIQVQPGKSYFVEIILADGSTYRSTPEVVPPMVRADSLSYDITIEEIPTNTGGFQERGLVNIYVNVPLPTENQKAHLKWSIEEAYSFTDLACGGLDLSNTCYFNKGITDPQTLRLFSNAENDAGYLSQFKLASVPLFPFYEYEGRHYFSVYQYNLTPAAFRYWEDVEKIINLGGSLFDPPPAAINGNIYNINEPEEVLGYVAAASADTIRFPTLPGDIYKYIRFPDHCLGKNFGAPHPEDPTECCFCQSFQVDADLVPRPDYW